jgi:hypothetical protein
LDLDQNRSFVHTWLGRLAFTRARKDLLVAILFRTSFAIHYEATSVAVKREEREGRKESVRTGENIRSHRNVMKIIRHTVSLRRVLRG